MTELPPEIVVLAWSVLLLIGQIALQGIAATRELGSAWNAGPRDGDRQLTGEVAGRARRALVNLLETYPAFVALALALVVAGQTGQWGATGAWVWLAARILYVPLYLAGIPYIRSVAWVISVLGLAVMLLSLVF